MKLLLLVATSFLYTVSIFASSIIHHDLKLNLKPFKGEIEVSDKFISGFKPEKIRLPIEVSNVAIKFNGMSLSFITLEQKNSSLYYPTYPSSQSLEGELEISYLYTPKEPSYQRGRMGRNTISSEVKAVIIDKGAYLSPSSYWYPHFENQLEYLDVEVSLPRNWSSMTTGELKSSAVKGERRIEKWQSYTPSERIFFIANEFKISEELYRGVKLQTYFHADLVEHNATYMKKLKAYLDIYLEQFGSYPYSKFSVVSNFFSTGYGMASYTLLDKNIIPYSFITETSLGHELLHNWWGNSVYVKGPAGNWCEGLTVYMADYLYEGLKSLEAAKAYRVSTLRDYNNYVNRLNRFPVKDFVSRFDNASRAIGYGKVFMIFSMLEDKIGKDTLARALRIFATRYQYKHASWKDIETVVSEISKVDLESFFSQWLERDYNIELKAEALSSKIISLEQSSSETFTFPVQIEFTSKGKKRVETFDIKGKRELIQTNIEFESFKIDPNFRLVRSLNDKENPATLSKVWGKNKINFLSNLDLEIAEAIVQFPTRADKSIQILDVAAFNQLEITQNTFYFLKSELADLKTVIDSHFKERGFSLNGDVLSFPKDYDLDAIKLSSKTLILSEMVNGKQITIIFGQSQRSLFSITSKLPHYGKYSYLLFNNEGRKVSGGIYN